jgi:hypothetical protein
LAIRTISSLLTDFQHADRCSQRVEQQDLGKFQLFAERIRRTDRTTGAAAALAKRLPRAGREFAKRGPIGPFFHDERAATRKTSVNLKAGTLRISSLTDDSAENECFR